MVFFFASATVTTHTSRTRCLPRRRAVSLNTLSSTYSRGPIDPVIDDSVSEGSISEEYKEPALNELTGPLSHQDADCVRTWIFRTTCNIHSRARSYCFLRFARILASLLGSGQRARADIDGENTMVPRISISLHWTRRHDAGSHVSRHVSHNLSMLRSSGSVSAPDVDVCCTSCKAGRQ